MNYSQRKMSLKIVFGAALILFFTSIKIIAQPLTADAGIDQTICSGASVTIGGSPTATFGAGGYTYFWSPSTGLSSTTVANPIASPTTTTTYTLQVTDALLAVAIDVITITVNPLPTVNGILSPTTCNGSTMSITSFTSTPAGATFNWTNSTPSIGLSASGTGDLPSFTAINSGTTPVVATISVTATLAGCSGPPMVYTITVNPSPTVNPTVTPFVCNGATVSGISFFSTPGGAAFNWTNSNPAIGLAASGTGNLPSFTATNSGSTVIGGNISVTATLAGCTGPAYVFSPTVKPTPVATSSPMAQTRCSGVNSNFVLTSTVSGTTFSWTTTGSGVSGNTASSGTVISQSVSATGSTAGTANYFVTPVAAGCTGSVINPVLTVDPIPVATSSSITICSGDTVSVFATSNVAGTTFTWTSFPSNVSGATASGSGSSLHDTLSATTTAVGSVVYVFTPVAAGCTGSQAFPVVTVNPIPNIIPFPLSYPPVCSGSLVSVTFNSSVFGSTYTWTSTESNTAGSALSGSGGISEFPTTILSSPGVTTYFVTPSFAGCAGTPLTYPINVNPTPNANFSLATPACQFGSNIIPTFGGSATPGVFSSIPVGLVFVDTLTGEIDLSTSAPGTYDITNTIVASGGCPLTTQTYTNYTINAFNDPTITDITSVCSNTTPFNFVAASSGGMWSGAGITNFTLGTFDPSTTGTGTYTITYTTSGICAYVDTTVISVTDADIYGKVTYSGGDLISGNNTAVLFNYSSTYSSFDSIQVSSIDATGYYHFTAVPPGDYLIEVFADTLVYPLAVPTYYDSEFLWDTAIVKTHGCSTDTADVYVIEGIITSGPGILSGTLTEGFGFVRLPGEPIPGIDVKLGKNPGGALVTNTQTDPSGNYAFTNIPVNVPGEFYTIYIDIPGLERDSIYDIIVTATNFIYTQLDYVADSNSVFPTFPFLSSIVSAEIDNQFLVFPNPTINDATIVYTLTNNTFVQIDVYDVLGKRLESPVNTTQQAGKQQINLNNLNPGVYFIKLNINNKSQTTRLVVVD